MIRGRLLAACLALAWLSPVVAEEVTGQATTTLDDGPYVFQTTARRYDAWWVCDGKVEHDVQRKRRQDTVIAPRCGYGRPAVIPSHVADAESVPYAGGRIVALSDIHGQYDLMVTLLRAHRVKIVSTPYTPSGPEVEGFAAVGAALVGLVEVIRKEKA